MTANYRWELPSSTKTKVLIPVLASILIHILGVLVAPFVFPAHPIPDEKTPPSRVKWVPVQERTKKPDGQIVDLTDPNHIVEKAPDDARFLSDANRRVEKQTQAQQSNRQPLDPATKAQIAQDNQRAIPKDGLNLKVPNDFLETLEKKSPHKKEQLAFAPSNYLPGIDVGNETLLDTSSFIYSSFFIRMKRQMESRWDPRGILSRTGQDFDEIRAAVSITLNSKGHVESVQLIRSSGLHAFDRDVMATVRAAGPYLNPPEGLRENDGRIRIPQWYFIFYRRTVF